MIYQLHQEPNEGHIEPHDSFCGQAEILNTATQTQFLDTLVSWVRDVQKSQPLLKGNHWVLHNEESTRFLRTTEEAPSQLK